MHKIYIHNTEYEYILTANKASMELYKKSKDILMESYSYDFMVFRFSNFDEILEDLKEWEDYVSIDEATYDLLHSNLCIKFKELIKYL